MSSPAPSVDQLRQAVAIAELIEKLQAELQALIAGGLKSGVPAVPAPAASSRIAGKRRMSPEARERIAAAQRARWAKSKGVSSKDKNVHVMLNPGVPSGPKEDEPKETGKGEKKASKRS